MMCPTGLILSYVGLWRLGMDYLEGGGYIITRTKGNLYEDQKSCNYTQLGNTLAIKSYSNYVMLSHDLQTGNILII